MVVFCSHARSHTVNIAHTEWPELIEVGNQRVDLADLATLETNSQVSFLGRQFVSQINKFN